MNATRLNATATAPLCLALSACAANDSTSMQLGGSAGVLIGAMIGSGLSAGSIVGTLIGAATGGAAGFTLALLV
jgi:hypothetical protein